MKASCITLAILFGASLVWAIIEFKDNQRMRTAMQGKYVCVGGGKIAAPRADNRCYAEDMR